MAEEIEFGNHYFLNFKSHMTLTLTSDDLESDYLVCDCIVSLWTYIWTDICTDVRTDGHFYRVY